MADKDFLDKSGTSYLWGKTKQKIDDAKASVDNYTINGKKISGSPKLTASDVGAAPVVAGKIPSQYMPSYVDDTMEIKDGLSVTISNLDWDDEDVYLNINTSKLTQVTDNIDIIGIKYDGNKNLFYLETLEAADEGAEYPAYYFEWDELSEDDTTYPASATFGTTINPNLNISGNVLTSGVKPTEGMIYIIGNTPYLAGSTLSSYTYESGKIYVNTLTNKTYRWSGSQLVEVGGGVALGETAETAFRGDRGAWIYNSIMQGNPDVVTPVIAISWTYYKNADTSNATAVTPEKNVGTAASPQIEIGYRAKYTATWKWTTESGKKNPTATSGTFGTTLPSSGVASASKATTVTGTTTISQTVTAPRQGLVVSNNAVVAPSGTDSASASHKITFLYKRYWGVTTATTITESIIKGLKDSELTSTKSKTITGVTAQKGEYYVIAYPTALGELSGIIQNGAQPVLSAFTRTTVSVTNAAGYAQNYYVYRTNKDGAFTSAKLALS